MVNRSSRKSRPSSSAALKEKYRRLAARETGAVIKDPGGRLPVAVVYANNYRIGMSNLGFHQLYRLINDYPGTLAERFFYEGAHQPGISLETFTPLGEFPLVLFSISWELDYFNIPVILEASGIPIYAKDRSEEHPIIIAGGACIMANPSPVAPFFDCLAIGEAEVLLPEIRGIMSDPGLNRCEKLKALASVPGMLVPGYSDDLPVKRVYLENLDRESCQTAIITPDAEFGHMYMVEVQRGCGRGCNFCMVNCVFAPLRFRSLENLLSSTREGYKHCNQIALVGPLVSAHPQAAELVASIREMGAQVSTSSLSVKPLPEELLAELAGAGARSVTMAPEAGSPELRRHAGKHFSDAEILDSVSKVARTGFDALKLYFMAGLPGETEDDIEAMKKLVLECQRVYGRKSLSINIAPFVPKPFTKFEREAVLPLDVLEERLAYLKRELSARKVKVKIESPAWSRMQAVLSRGDERLAPVIAELGKPTLTRWKRALEAAGIDDEEFLGAIPESKVLPWRVISL
jgi:radical SAM superfamily enzyme YgiQ (UPF0313 family)